MIHKLLSKSVTTSWYAVAKRVKQKTIYFSLFSLPFVLLHFNQSISKISWVNGVFCTRNSSNENESEYTKKAKKKKWKIQFIHWPNETVMRSVWLWET